MANFADKVTKFSAYLDEKYQTEALTGMLEIPAKMVEWTGTRTVKYPEIEMDGLVNYDRAAGFTAGNATITWGSLELKQDRANEFNIDVMDDDELAFTAFANLTEQFIRTRVVPEIDAFRFAKLVHEANEVTATQGNVKNVTDAEIKPAFKLLDDAEMYFIDNEIGMENTVLFVSATFYKAMKQDAAFHRHIDMAENTGKIKNYIGMWNDTPIVKVPKTRFNSAITLNTAGKNGYTATGKDVFFILLKLDDKKYGITKHQKLRYFTPEANQDADAHKIQYRIFHDLVVTNEGKKSIYAAIKKP